MPTAPPCWYFAFGANMNRRVLVERRRIVPISAEPGWILDHRLTFDEPGIPVVEPCFASIRPAPGHRVHGVLYRLHADDKRSLDRFEGPGYEGHAVVVYRQGSSPVPAKTYRSLKRAPGRIPSCRYLRLMADGAARHGLPLPWQDALRQHPCRSVPIASRLMPWVVLALETSVRHSRRGAEAVQSFYRFAQSRHTRQKNGDLPSSSY